LFDRSVGQDFAAQTFSDMVSRLPNRHGRTCCQMLFATCLSADTSIVAMTVRTNSAGARRMTKVAIGYVRVSTEGQATECVSMDAQQAKIQAWFLANDVELGSIFFNAGLSGKTADI